MSQAATSSTPLTRIEMPSATSGDDIFGGTRAIHSAYVFSVDKQIGEGTYGQVFMGHDRKTNDKVALKKIRMDTEKEGFPITAIREIKILSQLSHPNVVNLREIVRSEIHKNNNFKGSIYMVFDYAEFDLTGLMESTKYTFTEPQVKCILKQLLKGLAYCHNNGVLHRDLKASNILIDARGTVKLADFGLARPYSAENDAGFTNRVITLWYRPPELLLGAVKYGGEVDMWSVGCIFAELLTGKPLFPGKDEVDQGDKIFQIMGAPTEQSWPGVSSLKLHKNVPVDKYPRQNRLRETLRGMLQRSQTGRQVSEDAVRLLEKMLCLDPKRRITAAEAVMDPYMWADPMPCEPQQLPCRGTGHEFTMKKRRNDGHREQAVGAPMPMPGVPGAYNNPHHGYGPGTGPDAKRPRFGAPGPGAQAYAGAAGGMQRQAQQQPYAGAAGAGPGYAGVQGSYNRAGSAGGTYGVPPQQQQQQYGQRQDAGGRAPQGGYGVGGGMGPPQHHAQHGMQGMGPQPYGSHGSGGPAGYRGGPAAGGSQGGYGAGGPRGAGTSGQQGWQQPKR